VVRRLDSRSKCACDEQLTAKDTEGFPDFRSIPNRAVVHILFESTSELPQMSHVRRSKLGEHLVTIGGCQLLLLSDWSQCRTDWSVPLKMDT